MEAGPPVDANDSLRDVDVGEVSLRIRESGHGPLVVLLHGFPEFAGAWDAQRVALAEAGYRAVAVDLRGYGGSGKPEPVAAYRIERLAEDIATLVRALGHDDALIVGHDWGAMVAWQVAMAHPDVVRGLAILNVPHPKRMLEGLTTLRQLKKSWYIGFFQLPALPEWLLGRKRSAGLRAIFLRDGMPRARAEEYAREVGPDVHYGLQYYRAARSALLRPTAAPTRIDVPVLVLWGERDRFLGKELAVPPPDLVPHARVRFLPHATHWLQEDAADEVSAELVGFAAETASSTPQLRAAAFQEEP